MNIDESPDATWLSLVETRDHAMRSLTRVLPYRIGITARPDGNFSDYVREPLMFDLPALIADETSVAPERSRLWTRAHHCAGFYSLMIDRVADRQVVADDALRDDERWMLEQLRAALTAACGDESAARERIERTHERWSAAIATELAWSPGIRVTPREYGAVVRKKCGFLWMTSEAMLQHTRVPPSRIAGVREAFERVMIALQCSDDARDADEDQETRGVCTADALGIDEHALFATSAMLLQRIGAIAPPAAIAAYAERATSYALSAIPAQKRLSAALGAMSIVHELEQ